MCPSSKAYLVETLDPISDPGSALEKIQKLTKEDACSVLCGLSSLYRNVLLSMLYFQKDGNDKLCDIHNHWIRNNKRVCFVSVEATSEQSKPKPKKHHHSPILSAIKSCT